MNVPEIFAVPIASSYLFYAPLHRLAAVINQSALAEIKLCLGGGKSKDTEINELFDLLQTGQIEGPEIRTGSVNNPFFLGIIPTRDCNMACRYCDFIHSDKSIMSMEIARQSVDAYLQLLLDNEKDDGEIHFFGGEPFFVPEMVQSIVAYAENKAQQYHLDLHFEGSTNGYCSESLAIWISNHFDSVVLSLDGYAEIHNAHRPLKKGNPSFDQVYRSAKIFSAGDCELIIRNCVSAMNVNLMPEIADWYAEEFIVSSVCFEPLTETAISLKNQLFSPEPLTFTRKFIEAASILERHGIHSVLSTADLSKVQFSSCPVGNDPLIVSPDGTIDACYLPQKQRRDRGLDMPLGEVTKKGFLLNEEAVNRARAFSIENKPLCKNCFCRFHCSGGCHVNHDTDKNPGDYDDLCIRTRSVSAALLLNYLGMHDMLESWMGDEKSMLITVQQKSDRLTPFNRN